MLFDSISPDHKNFLDNFFKGVPNHDKSYIINGDGAPQKQENLPQEIKEGMLNRQQKAQQKLAQVAFDNRIKHVLKVKANGKG